jgi:hypothetical protein
MDERRPPRASAVHLRSTMPVRPTALWNSEPSAPRPVPSSRRRRRGSRAARARRLRRDSSSHERRVPRGRRPAVSDEHGVGTRCGARRRGHRRAIAIGVGARVGRVALETGRTPTRWSCSIAAGGRRPPDQVREATRLPSARGRASPRSWSSPSPAGRREDDRRRACDAELDPRGLPFAEEGLELVPDDADDLLAGVRLLRTSPPSAFARTPSRSALDDRDVDVPLESAPCGSRAASCRGRLLGDWARLAARRGRPQAVGEGVEHQTDSSEVAHLALLGPRYRRGCPGRRVSRAARARRSRARTP